MTKIIHCADIHLDSKMESNLPRKLANQRRAEIRDTFVRLAAYAQDNSYGAVIIAGDMFDESRSKQTTLEMVFDAIKNAPDVDFLYLKGNHDETDFFGDAELPANLRRFGDAWTTFDYGDVAISGVEFTRENYKTIYRDFEAVPGKANIVALHGQVATQPGMDEIALGQFAGQPVDYFALGHIHGYQQGTVADGGIWCYAGCLEGRGFDELGPKGFVSVEVEDGRLNCDFVPFAQRELHEVPVDVTGLLAYPDIKAAFAEAARGISADDLVKFTLVGQKDPQANVDEGALLREFADRFFFAKMKDESRLRIDPGDYENDVSLRGEFVRTVLGDDTLSAEDRDRVLLYGLKALSGEEVSR